MKKEILVLVAVVLLLVAFAAGRFLYEADRTTVAEEQAAATMAVLIRPDAPTLGPADAPVVIVEFLDPACETCHVLYPMVKQLMAANPDKIRLVVRFAPFHQGSTEVVAALEAARKQEKFWPALEALLATQADWAPNHTSRMDLAWPFLEGLGLDFDQMRADMMTAANAGVVAQALEDTRTLNVTKTPEFFVNGKPLPSFGFEQLKTLVDEEIRASAQR